MSTDQQNPSNKTQRPAWFTAAKEFYAIPFEPQTKQALAASMADWEHLTSEEQSFTIAHLSYLNLLAQRTTHVLLRRLPEELIAELEELAEELTEPRDEDDEDADSLDDQPIPVSADGDSNQDTDLLHERPSVDADVDSNSDADSDEGAEQ